MVYIREEWLGFSINGFDIYLTVLFKQLREKTAP